MEIPNAVVPRKIQPQDDVAGSSRIERKIRRTDGQHDGYVPTDNEIQVTLYTETNSCTNQGTSNSIDTQGNEMLDLNEIPTPVVSKLQELKFIVNEKWNTSERYNAIKSGTNGGLDPNRPKGNYAYKPWDSARNDGMIPEALLPSGRYLKLSEWFTLIETDEIKEAAQFFNDNFVIQYEQGIGTDLASLKYHLQEAPITIITGVCPGWGGDAIIPSCPISSGHETLLYGYNDLEKFYKDFDSYIPTRKRLAYDYLIGYAIKGVMKFRDSLSVLKYNFTKQMGVEKINSETVNDHNEVRNLQIALFLEGVLDDSSWPTREHVAKFGGYFGSNTEMAVKRFQAKYGIKQTGYVGPLTLAKLNSIYNV